MRGFIQLVAVGAAVAGSPVQAATCWNDMSYQAAQVRDFDTMLMVQTLRCRINDIDFSSDYNRFVKDKRAVLAGANQELRAKFAESVGPTRALNAYDDFSIKIANGYGAGKSGMNCRDYAALARAAASAPVARAAIVALAEDAGSNPPVPGRRCDTRVALRDGK